MPNCECGHVTMLPVKNMSLGFDLSGLECGQGGGGEADFSVEEHETGARWIDGSKIYRRVVDFGALPNSTTKDVACPIPDLKTMVRMYGVGMNMDKQNGFPLPYPAAGLYLISLQYLPNQNISINTGIDRRAQRAFVILEYTCSNR